MHTMPTPNPYNETQTPQRRRNVAPVVVVGLLLLAGLLAGALLIGRGSQVATSNVRATSLGAKQGGQAEAAAGTTTTGAPADGVIVVSDGNDTGAPTQAPSNPAPANATPPAPPAPQSNPQPSAPAPVITSFSTPENIDCHNGMSQTFTASWSTTNASSVTISIDGPGVYKTYGPSGSDSLPFNCSSSHTFLLTAHGANGQVATKSITLQPRNVQMPESADADEQ